MVTQLMVTWSANVYVELWSRQFDLTNVFHDKGDTVQTHMFILGEGVAAPPTKAYWPIADLLVRVLRSYSPIEFVGVPYWKYFGSDLYYILVSNKSIKNQQLVECFSSTPLDHCEARRSYIIPACSSISHTITEITVGSFLCNT